MSERNKQSKTSLLAQRSVTINGRQTSVSIELEFWNGLREIAAAQGTTISELVESIDSGRQYANLSSAIRVFVLSFYRDGSSIGAS